MKLFQKAGKLKAAEYREESVKVLFGGARFSVSEKEVEFFPKD